MTKYRVFCHSGKHWNRIWDPFKVLFWWCKPIGKCSLFWKVAPWFQVHFMSKGQGLVRWKLGLIYKTRLVPLFCFLEKVENKQRRGRKYCILSLISFSLSNNCFLTLATNSSSNLVTHFSAASSAALPLRILCPFCIYNFISKMILLDYVFHYTSAQIRSKMSVLKHQWGNWLTFNVTNQIFTEQYEYNLIWLNIYSKNEGFMARSKDLKLT